MRNSQISLAFFVMRKITPIPDDLLRTSTGVLCSTAMQLDSRFSVEKLQIFHPASTSEVKEFISTLRTSHSTGIHRVIFRVHSNISDSLDAVSTPELVYLDISAALDVIYHSILDKVLLVQEDPGYCDCGVQISRFPTRF